MTKDNPSTKERLAVVETEVKYIKKELREVNGSLKTYNKELKSLSGCVDAKLRGSLSNKEKVQLWVSMIASIGAIIVALLANLDRIVGLFP